MANLIRRVLRRLERFKNLSELEDLHRLSLRQQRVTTALARGAATSLLRQKDPSNPVSWTFSGFSQNGEDGVIEHLTGGLRTPNRYFIEIGGADGLENNTSWLAVARRYSGLMVEADCGRAEVCRQLMADLNIHVESLCLSVTPDNVNRIVSRAVCTNPDVFSIDIDGVDYYVTDALLKEGLRPRICVVEYNSAFGPQHSQTIEYRSAFRCDHEHPEKFLYYGVGLRGWRNFFSRHGYEFVTVEENGINAFFVDPSEFQTGFLASVKGLEYGENVWHRIRFRTGWESQYEVIRKIGLVDIEGSKPPGKPLPIPLSAHE